MKVIEIFNELRFQHCLNLNLKLKSLNYIFLITFLYLILTQSIQFNLYFNTKKLDLQFRSYDVFKISAQVQPKFRHDVSHYQHSKFCPELPNIAKIYPNLSKQRTLKYNHKSRFQCFLVSMYRTHNRAWFSCLDFQSQNFSYAVFIVKKWPWYVNFNIHPCRN